MFHFDVCFLKEIFVSVNSNKGRNELMQKVQMRSTQWHGGWITSPIYLTVLFQQLALCIFQFLQLGIQLGGVEKKRDE